MHCVQIDNGICITKKKEMLSFAATSVDLEILYLVKSGRERQNMSLICGIQEIQKNLCTEQKQIHKHRK